MANKFGITRTIKVQTIKYTAYNSETKELVSMEVLNPDFTKDTRKLEKLCTINAASAGLTFVVIDDVMETSTLYGMSVEDFLTHASAIKTENE